MYFASVRMHGVDVECSLEFHAQCSYLFASQILILLFTAQHHSHREELVRLSSSVSECRVGAFEEGKFYEVEKFIIFRGN